MGDNLELPQGTLDLLILRTVSLEPQHGWAIAERIQQISSDVLRLQQGSLYPALHRLERKDPTLEKPSPSRRCATVGRSSDEGGEARMFGPARRRSRKNSWRRKTSPESKVVAQMPDGRFDPVPFRAIGIGDRRSLLGAPGGGVAGRAIAAYLGQGWAWRASCLNYQHYHEGQMPFVCNLVFR